MRASPLYRHAAVLLLVLAALIRSLPAYAIAPDVVRELAFGDNDAKIAALGTS